MERQEFEEYKFAMRELRTTSIIKLIKFLSILTFVGCLCVTFGTYTPCLFLLLLAL